MRNAATNEPALEIGPGPGVTTDYLSTRVRSLTALERDPLFAENLRARFRGTNVQVIEGDGASMPF
jgi:16S rRNA A1518/A1519 N6-dimethyltransferase RsmA/KsgA/DIM1 with predicted DNA glycosylase/AP lyase activity